MINISSHIKGYCQFKREKIFGLRVKKECKKTFLFFVGIKKKRNAI